MKLRSPTELAFRAWQQSVGILDYIRTPPRFTRAIHPLPQLKDAPQEEPDIQLAEAILRHDFPIFGDTISTGPAIDWRRDYHYGIDTPVKWFRRIPFLNFQISGDHKYIWELNRHQHLVVLAQAFRSNGDGRYIAEIETQLENWNQQNPYLRSINWASSLELAFRAISWLWILHFVGNELSPHTRDLLGMMLNQHGIAISHNLSTYFAPNTHLLGEGVALHAIGLALGNHGWRNHGASIVKHQLMAQVPPDGLHFERSTYYHLYALDLFLIHYVLADKPVKLEPLLHRMADATAALLSPATRFPRIGDDDGGRAFHPYGERARFAAGTLANCARLFPRWNFSWALGDLCVHLHHCGISVFRRGKIYVSFDRGSFARGGAGHSHADTLALTLSVGDQEVLVDPGTYTYVADPVARDWFRGTEAHSTVKLDGKDQADPVKPFFWRHKPSVRTISEGDWAATGECFYRDWLHRRAIRFEAANVILVEDTVHSPDGSGLVEQIWHSAFPVSELAPHCIQAGPLRIEMDPRLRIDIRNAWRSPVFGTRIPSYLLVGTIDAPPASPLITTLTVL